MFIFSCSMSFSIIFPIANILLIDGTRTHTNKQTKIESQKPWHEVRLARDDRLRKTWDRVLEKTDGLATLFEGVDVKPSVLHGDLWSGNIAAVDGEPAIFDPAVYYGHHEAEWGMSWCASLTPAFWKGYREVIPLA